MIDSPNERRELATAGAGYSACATVLPEFHTVTTASALDGTNSSSRRISPRDQQSRPTSRTMHCSPRRRAGPPSYLLLTQFKDMT